MPWIEAKYRGSCCECPTRIAPGDWVYYNGKTYCEDCGGEVAPEDEDDEDEVETAEAEDIADDWDHEDIGDEDGDDW